MAIRIGLGRADKLLCGDMYSPTILGKALDSAISSWLGCPDTGLNSFISNTDKVLIKPNFVTHCRNPTEERNCVTTNHQLIVQILRKVVACSPREIVLGDAPIQGCIWDKLITPEMKKEFEEIAVGIPFRIVDYRRTKYSEGLQETEIVSEEDYIHFDLGGDSYLEPITTKRSKFRVAMYDHRKLNRKHFCGHHQYLVARDAIEANVVISIPKLKTHKKAGVTGALKNVVGINGNKEYLPHHRKGSLVFEGDCYSKPNLFKSILETLNDLIYANKKHKLCCAFVMIQKFVSRIYRVFRGVDWTSGSWHGNDTVWRTTLDLNRVLYFGKTDGSIAKKKQRKVLTITDAMICGENDGPLYPSPLFIGAITVCERPDSVDWFHSRMLGIDPEKIPLIYEAQSLFHDDEQETVIVVYNGMEYDINDTIFDYPRAVMPLGWRDF